MSKRHEYPHGRDWAWTGHGYGRARHGRIVSERHGYPLNSLGLSVSDRAWEGLGWAHTGHEHRRDWARIGHGIGHGLGTGLGTDWARAWAGWARANCVRTSWVPTWAGLGTGLGTGTGEHSTGEHDTGGLCPNVTGTHLIHLVCQSMTRLGKGWAGHGLGTGGNWARTGHGHGQDWAWARTGRRIKHGHGQIVSEGHGYPLV
jgi:hypothetical protein